MKKSLVIGIFVILSIISLPSAFATALFSTENFEDGNNIGWTAFNSATLTTSSTLPINGTYSMIISGSAIGGGRGAYFDTNLTSDLNDYLTVFLSIKNDQTGNSLFYLQSDNNITFTNKTTWINQNDGVFSGNFACHGNDTGVSGNDVNIHNIRLDIDYNNETLDCWIDGIKTNTGINISGTPKDDYWVIISGHSGSAVNLKIDDFSMNSSTQSTNFIVNGKDSYSGNTINNFSMNMTDAHGIYEFSTTNGTIITNISTSNTELWNITVSSNNYIMEIFQDINVNLTPTYIAYMAVAKLRTTAINTYTNESILAYNITNINNSKIYSTTNGSLELPISNGTFNFISESNGFISNPSFNISFNIKEIKEYEIQYSPTYTFEFWDEKTLKLFNMSSFDSLQFQVICSNETQLYELNSSSQNYTFTPSCQYTKLRFLLEYGADVYYRTLLLPKTGVNKKVFLLNLDDTTSVFNTFISYDLINTCPTPTIIFYKTIESATEQITGDYADAEDKVSAYLLLGGEYNIGLTCSGETERNIGSYIADTAGQKIIRIFNIGIGTTTTDFDGKMFYSIYSVNESGTIKLRAYYNDTSGTTTKTTFTVREFGGSTALYSASSSSQDITYSYSVPAYLDDAYLVVDFNITNPTYGNRNYFKNIQPVTILTLPTYFNSPQTLKFILLGIIIVLALMFTISTSNVGTLLLGGAGSFLAVIGWYPIAAGIITLMLLVGLIQIFREGENKK